MGSPLQTRLRSTQDVLQARPTCCPLLLHLLLQQCQRGCHGSCWRHWSASVYAAQVEPSWPSTTSLPPLVLLPTSPTSRLLDVLLVSWEPISLRPPLSALRSL